MKSRLNKILLFFTIVLSSVLFVFILFMNFSVPNFVGINNFQVISFSDGKVKGTADLLIRNSNWVGIDCRDLYVELKEGDYFFAEANQTKLITLESDTNSSLPVNFAIQFSPAESNIADLLKRDTINFTGNFSGKFTVLGININKPLSFSIGTQDLIKSVLEESSSKSRNFKITDWSIKELAIDHTILSVTAEVKNTLPLDISCNEINLQLFADESCTQSLANWKDDNQIKIAMNEKSEIKSDIRINNFEIGLSGLNKAITGHLDYYVKGFGLIDLVGYEIRVPVFQRLRLDITNHTIEVENL